MRTEFDESEVKGAGFSISERDGNSGSVTTVTDSPASPRFFSDSSPATEPEAAVCHSLIRLISKISKFKHYNPC